MEINIKCCTVEQIENLIHEKENIVTEKLKHIAELNDLKAKCRLINYVRTFNSDELKSIVIGLICHGNTEVLFDEQNSKFKINNVVVLG